MHWNPWKTSGTHESRCAAAPIEVFAQRSQLIRKNIWPPPAPLHLGLQDPHDGLLPAWLGAALDQPGALPPLRLPLHLLPRPLHPLRRHRHRPALPRQEEGSRRRALADHGLGGGGPDLRHLLPHLCPRHRHALAGHLVGPGLPSNSPLKCLPLLCVFFAINLPWTHTSENITGIVNDVPCSSYIVFLSSKGRKRRKTTSFLLGIIQIVGGWVTFFPKLKKNPKIVWLFGHCFWTLLDKAQKKGFFLGFLPFKLPSKIIFVSLAFFCQELTALTHTLKIRRLK